jgi:hypothetical protein
MMYVRFVVGVDSESANRQDGLFTELVRLRDSGYLMDYQLDLIQSSFDFFNDKLPVPPYRRKNLSKNAVA